ncbi:MAG: hypothetical protein D6708_14250 [Candidatus Dadabacteria bacterium]|nr:MAG: hypothetical protein D6708_14250 [Candidatus Dadabacteria bacterium]
MNVGAWIARFVAVEGDGPRRALWAEALGAGPAPEAAAVLDALVRQAALRDVGAGLALRALADLEGMARRVGPGRMADLLAAARDRDLDAALLVLEHPGRPRRGEELGPPPDPAVEAHTLGHRKTAARGPRSPLLERLLTDPDPRVVRELLRNPRLREAEVLGLTSRRPCPEAVFWHLARAPRWIARPAVQRAVIRNPYAPPRLALVLLVPQPDPFLTEVANDEGLHPAVRDGALRILGWRRRA